MPLSPQQTLLALGAVQKTLQNLTPSLNNLSPSDLVVVRIALASVAHAVFTFQGQDMPTITPTETMAAIKHLRVVADNLINALVPLDSRRSHNILAPLLSLDHSLNLALHLALKCKANAHAQNN